MRQEKQARKEAAIVKLSHFVVVVSPEAKATFLALFFDFDVSMWNSDFAQTFAML